ncbi:cAMP-binding domain of CRP or a regulatory subunit of cAMP-dependent protein kinases [Halobacillus karajensis]|uniref:Regulatory protein YeiL n=1 Tax=Halobacillus karajensis TaxID=195088 RepID=A0A024P6G4_9BACI|nr:cyclic nucleotide-binding domain-containing protein [Halobacillus karajensis]CDQ17810.1 Regulatory protein YeiL [Halobacillus karajensis]CDQ24216.1 Regulatory protein YeiL [Halobacillus karajensis]CDQ29535.1 Regulatory protein YeiL [Halobacillus karajensis]SEH63436.1 cAMP-binding domain of CRP or a regulatory subunit of cAMP-dependent protein kinases [Halobacillus karajensis]
MKENKGIDSFQYMKDYELERIFPVEFRKKMRVYSFHKGDLLFTTGQMLNELYFLVEGKIKIYTLTPEGKSLINRFKRPLGVIGDVEYVKGSPVINSVEAVSDGVMLAATFTDLKVLEANHPPFTRFLLETVAHKFYTESQATSLHMLYPVEVRLASYLLSISSDGEGTLFHQEMRTENLTELAEWVGTSYRHLNRVLKRMNAGDIIERLNGSIKIKDLEKLRHLANGNIYE